MRISKIQLKNGYKRFHDLTVNLGPHPKKIIALVGPNGSGKSSVFDGMIFLQQAFRAIGRFGAKGDTFHSMTGSSIDAQASIIINFDTGERFDQVYSRKHPSGDSATIFNLRNPYRFNTDLNITTQQSLVDIKNNANGASSSVDLDDKMTENYQRLHIHLNEYRKVNDLTDKQANEQVIGRLNTMLSQCLGLTIVSHGDIMAGKGTLYFSKTNQPTEFSFNVLSSGEKEVVDLLLDIFLKLNDYNETIYLIDEPELHLSTAIQKKVLIAIEELIPDTCQLWIATHSIGFLSALQNELNDISDIIDFDGDYSRIAVSINPIIKNRKNWQKIFKTALEDLTGLLAPTKIIYCEGRSDPTLNGEDQGLDAEVYNIIFSEKYPDILFVSSGGNTEPDKYASIALTVLNKAFNTVEILLLKDKDINRDSSPTTDAQRIQFLVKNPHLHRMLRRKEIENYVFDFEVVSKAFPTIDQAAYRAIIPNINDDVKAKASALMRQSGIANSMNKDQYKTHLASFITPDMGVFHELDDLLFISPLI